MGVKQFLTLQKWMQTLTLVLNLMSKLLKTHAVQREGERHLLWITEVVSLSQEIQKAQAQV